MGGALCSEVFVSVELFKALAGIRFVYASRIVCSLEGGLYSNGRGAVQVYADSEPYCVLSVNLPDEPLEADEFFCRTGAEQHTDIKPVRAAVLGLRIFEPTGVFVSSGFVEDYATRWKFATCKHGTRTVLCSECRAAIESSYQEKIERILSADAVKRLGGGRP